MKIVDEANTYISEEAIIAEDVVIYPNTSIRGTTTIKSGCIIDMNTIITDSIIGENTYIKNSIIESNNIIGTNNQIGPFTHLRENNTIGNNNIIGSYVEITKSNLKDNNKIKHLSYIGNANIGNNCNIGAGVIFANFHPKKKIKQEITLEDNVDIGANSTLVAPLVIKENTLIGAHSKVSKDIDENSLYINKEEEIYKKNYYGDE